MKKYINILIVDDHPTMVEGYKTILDTYYSSDDMSIVSAYNCENAFKIINSGSNFDIVLLDINLPSFESEKIFSGEDLAVLVRKNNPQTKIVMVTSHTETFLLFNLIKKINPEGLLVKSDFTSNDFLTAFVDILNGQICYTATARQSLKDVYIENNYLDAYNRRIITLLGKGIATKNLPDHLNLSISAIDKRKAQIKIFFNIEKGNDEDIIREAKRKGFI